MYLNFHNLSLFFRKKLSYKLFHLSHQGPFLYSLFFHTFPSFIFKSSSTERNKQNIFWTQIFYIWLVKKAWKWQVGPINDWWSMLRRLVSSRITSPVPLLYRLLRYWILSRAWKNNYHLESWWYLEKGKDCQGWLYSSWRHRKICLFCGKGT